MTTPTSVPPPLGLAEPGSTRTRRIQSREGRDRRTSNYSRFEQLVDKSYGTLDKEAIEGRAKRVGLQILQTTLLILNTRSTSIVSRLESITA